MFYILNPRINRSREEQIQTEREWMALASGYIWYMYAARLLPSCLTLCKPIDGSPPGSPVPGILQARALEWVAISFLMKVKEESDNAGLKLSIQKTKTMVSCPITSWQIEGEKWKQ